MAAKQTLFLLTCFGTDGAESERLVSAETRARAVSHALKVNKASSQDVARVLTEGGKIEEARE